MKRTRVDMLHLNENQIPQAILYLILAETGKRCVRCAQPGDGAILNKEHTKAYPFCSSCGELDDAVDWMEHYEQQLIDRGAH